MSWDAFQREALAELGIEVYALGGTSAAPELIDAPVANSSAQTADVLLRHLLKAAGGDAREQDVLALAQPLSGLRGNAAAKRALWPLLRGMRRL
ncbi:hypothetical protein [Lysobacter silvestris]|uniref:Uncharacterized protein n=1 Tax=Solilutibacter silvestris TaxID=1645665 RepID=A0A2K1Q2I5_9GAMM|nr:hypothetical protein [Lysobacter silvestris]PNS09243.1 hypothetical protein Lysil_0872 [Lysobacter silvestris]